MHALSYLVGEGGGEGGGDSRALRWLRVADAHPEHVSDVTVRHVKLWNGTKFSLQKAQESDKTLHACWGEGGEGKK